MSEFANKTILITGATGLIGSHIVDKLMSYNDVRVIALGRSEKKIKEGFKEYLDSKLFTYIVQDISEPLEIGRRVDYIFHAAGPMEGKIIRERPMDVINPNIVGLINCLRVLYNQKEGTGYSGRLVVFSSVTVYGNITGEDITVTEEQTRVTDNLDTLSAPYSQSKRMAEVVALSYARQFGIDVVIPRFSTVYGATRFIPDTAFFEFINKSICGNDIVLNNGNLPKRDNIYIDDAVDGLLTVALKGKSGEAYNISSNGELDNYAAVDEIAFLIAKIVNSVFDKNVIVKYLNKTDESRKPGLKMDNAKLKNLGWKLTVSHIDGIQKTIEFLQKK